MFKREKKRSVSFYFVCYNLIILTIPLTLNILWYSQSAKLVEKNIIENSDTLLHQSQRVIDERLRQVRSMAINIASENDVRRYSNQTDSKSPDSIYINYLVDKLLGKYTSTESFVDTMFVYYNNTQVILSNQDNSRDPHDFFKCNAKLFGGTEKKWFEYLYSNLSNVFFNNDDGQQGAIVYLLNVPVGNLDKNSDKLGICLNRSFVSDVFSATSLPNSALRCIVDSNSNILYSDGNPELYRLFDHDETSPYNNRVVKGDGNTKFMVSYITSDEADWRYVCITPYSAYMKHFNNFRLFGYIIAGFGLLIGFFLSFHFARKSSRPIVAISKLIDVDLSGNNLWEDSKEWRKIENAVRTHLDFASDIMLHNILFRNSVVPGQDLPEDLINSFPYRRFVCAIIDVFELPQYMYDISADRLQFLLNNVAQDICRTVGTVRVIYYEPKCYAVIFNLSNEINDADEEITAFFAMLREILWESLSIDSFISIGNLHHSFSGVSQSFAEARQIREYMPLLRNSNTICFKNFRDIRPYDYPIAAEIQMMGFIKQGDCEKAMDVLNQVVNQNFNRPDFTANMARGLLLQIQNTLVNTFKDMNISFDTVFGESGNPFKNLPSPFTREGTVEFLENILKKSCTYIAELKSSVNSKKIEKIISYINENYANPNLSLCMLSDKFHMNQTYLSTFFREQTGENFINYIRKIKIKKAKDLLKDTNLPLRAVAEKIGYNNSSILIQNFKRETGITPTQYRTELSSNSENENTPL